MGQPRSSRRNAVIVSSDEDEDGGPRFQDGLDEVNEQVETSVDAPKKTTGKLKPITKKTAKTTQRPTPPSSTQNGSSQKSPAKAKPSSKSSKNNATAKEPPRASTRTIHSFFNAATQRLQNSQPSASPEKLPIVQDEPETIHDDSDNGCGSSVQLAKGSSTALAVRKRKPHDGTAFDSHVDLPPASQKFRKTSDGERIPSFAVSNEDKRPWTDQFTPKDTTELAVHHKKIADVKQWLQMAISGQRNRVLVLKGAAGTGKTITMRLLAKELGLQLLEWRNPGGLDLTAEGSVSSALQFNEFVGRAGQLGGLMFSGEQGDDVPMVEATTPTGNEPKSQVLLVEEFPNTFSRSSGILQSFRSTIMQYLSSPCSRDVRPTPLVMVISETLLSTNTALADSFTAHRLLGPELCNHPYLDTIEFNAIAQTILFEGLQAIVLKEARKSGRRKTPGPLVLKRISESGDIRSAVSSLEFLCLRGDDGDAWSSKITFTKQKKSRSDPPLTKFEEEALKLVSSRESTLGIFHAVGKVVYNKRVEAASIPHPPPCLAQHRRNKVPENDIDELINELGTDTSTFVAALHENYALSCSSSSAEGALESLSHCIDTLSDADLLSVDRFSYGTRAFSGSASDSLRQDDMVFHVAVRGLWFNLPCPVHRTASGVTSAREAHQMFYPASLKLWKKREELEGTLCMLTAKLQSSSLLADGGGRDQDTQSTAGVERWKSNATFDTGSTATDADTVTTDRTNSAKTEMLLEYLPYVARIMENKTTSRTTVEQLDTVIRMQASQPDHSTPDDEDEGDETQQALSHQWATDRPDTEVESKSGGTKKKAKRRDGLSTEGGGLGIPVETRVEHLVLQDDDIEDD